MLESFIYIRHIARIWGTNRGSEKRRTYALGRIISIRRTISGSALINIHTLLDLKEIQG